MSYTITIDLPNAPQIHLPDNYVQPVALPDGGFGLFVGMDEDFAANPLDPGRLYADPAAFYDPTLADAATLPPWRFHTLEGAAEAAASLMEYVRRVP